MTTEELLANRAIEIVNLKTALRSAILDRSRVTQRCIDFDPGAGSTYEIDWMPKVKEWAALCDLDLEKHDPSSYTRI